MWGPVCSTRDAGSIPISCSTSAAAGTFRSGSGSSTGSGTELGSIAGEDFGSGNTGDSSGGAESVLTGSSVIDADRARGEIMPVSTWIDFVAEMEGTRSGASSFLAGRGEKTESRTDSVQGKMKRLAPPGDRSVFHLHSLGVLHGAHWLIADAKGRCIAERTCSMVCSARARARLEPSLRILQPAAR